MNKILWTFPVPSNCIYTGVRCIDDKSSVRLIFDYYDEENNDKVFNGEVKFEQVIAHRHSTEKFTRFIRGTYDNLCEIAESKWLHELVLISPEWANIDELRHYAIYLDSYGLYEVVAKNYQIGKIKRGTKDA